MWQPRCFAAAAAIGLLVGAAQDALAIPTDVVHVHDGTTVHWQQPGSPALAWDHATANMWNHNHLTDDPFSNLPSWNINKAWDDRFMHNSLVNSPATGFGHGIIGSGADEYVRYGWGAAFEDVDARGAVEKAYDDWQIEALVQFDVHADPWDLLGLDFRRVDEGAKEVTINFVENLGAYGSAYGSGGATSIDFEATPDITLSATGTWEFRVNGGDWDTSHSIATPWAFDGTPDSLGAFDFDFTNDGGTTLFEEGDLDWNFGSYVGIGALEIFEMDFLTIAYHEVGHNIALGHTGNGSAGIMKDDIAFDAHFGRTKYIDDDSALAVAIDYTYSVPEPSTVLLVGAGGVIAGLQMRRRTT